VFATPHWSTAHRVYIGTKIKFYMKEIIHTVRGLQVILDSDLARLYGVSVKRLNEQVRRNAERFPDNFMFQLTESELKNLRFQSGTLKNEKSLRSQFATSRLDHGGRRYLPYAFTEQGVAMLSGVLRSKIAIQVSIQIMEAFVSMRKFISNNAEIFMQLDSVQRKLIEHDQKFEEVFKAIESDIKPKKGIFFNGQVFDAYTFVSDLIRSAKKKIILIDNYVDDTVLTLFSKGNVKVTIYTKNISKQLKLDVEKFNSQYKPIEIKEFTDSHDRFMVIDDIVYHFGASLKDLGKKWFAFSKFDEEKLDLLRRLRE
jgi:hypothetical protein